MNKFYRNILFSILLIFIVSTKGFATHIVGGAITYSYNILTPNVYTITMKLYRDMTGAAAPANVPIAILRADGSQYLPNLTLNPVLTVTLPVVLPPCATSPSVIPQVQEWTYTRTVTILPIAGGVHLYYGLCCRNPNATNLVSPGTTQEGFYAYIPMYIRGWAEDFNLPNGTTVDAGVTAWTRTTTAPNGTVAPVLPVAAVNGQSFEVISQNSPTNGIVTWASQVIPINTFTNGVNLSVGLFEPAADQMEVDDSIRVFYSVNGLPSVPFTTNGFFADDINGRALATATNVVGNNIQIFVRMRFGNLSPNNEIYRIDMVSIYDNTFIPNTNPAFTSLPPLLFCTTNTFAFSQGAIDPDGDVLVYSMYTPYDNTPAPTYPDNLALMTPVTFAAGYSSISPFNSGGPNVTLNPGTGLMTGVQNLTGGRVFGVKCSEYRNGNLLSESTRDFEVIGVVCPPFVPAPPTAGALNNPVCVGQTLSLTATFTAGATYSWTGPNGFTSALQNPTIPGITLLGAGVYSVSFNIGGCVGPPGTITIVVNPIPTAPVAASNSTICAGATLSLTATFTPGATFNWSGPNAFTSVLQNPTIVGATTLASGTYSVTRTVGGCTSPPGTTNVTVNAIPIAPTAASNSSICAGSTLSLTALPGGGIYSWTGPNAFSSVLQNPTIVGATTLATGMYSVTINLLGCTSAAATTSVTVNGIPVAPTAASNSSICAGSTLSLTANPGGGIYSWTGPNAFTSVLQNPTIVGATTLATGMYSVTINLLGCTSAAATTSVTVNGIPVAPTAASNSSICAGSTLSLTALPGGGIYSWTGPNAFTSVLQNPTIVGATTLATGMYSVTINLLGCTSAAATTSVTVNGIPIAPTAASNSSICAGSTLSLTALPGGGIYSWTGPNAFTSVLQNPTIVGATTLATGMYSVTINLLGCTSAAATTSVTVNPIPAAPTAASNSTICAGSTLSLTANPGGAIYSWTGPNAFTSVLQNPTIVGATTLASGTYSVSQTLLGCTSPLGTTNVTINPIPTAPTAASNSSICAGSTLSLTANPGGAIYSWTGPNAFTSILQNPTIVGATTLATGMYSVTQTLLGCTGPAGTTSVTVNPIPAAPTAASNSTICAGSTLSLTANPGGAIYSWTGPNAFTSVLQNPTIVGATTLASGTYSVSQTLLGCTSPIGTTNVTVNPIPSAPTAASNSTICAGSTLSLTANPGGAIYSWTGPNAFTSVLQNPTIVGATTLASGTYSVTRTLLGCTSLSGTTSVTVNPIPAAPTAASNSSICAGSVLTLSANPGGGIYSWTGPNAFTSVLQNPTIAGATTLATGMYSVTINLLGCTSAAGTTSVTVNPIPAAPTAASNSSICAGSILTLSANPGGGIYSWTGPNAFTSVLQNPTIAGATTLATGMYSVTINLLGCTSAAGTTSVTVNPTPVAPSAASNSSICAGSILTLSANPGGGIYSWSGPNAFTSVLQNPTIPGATTLATGMYSVTITLLGCTSAAGTTSVTVNPIPAAPTAASNSTICAGQTLSLTANPGGAFSYSWTGPNTFTSNVQNPTIVGASSLATGMYSVTQTVLGCTGPAGTTSVTVNPIPATPTAANNSTICSGSTLSLTANPGGATYFWLGPNAFTSVLQNPTIVGATTLATGMYSVTQTLLGCTSAEGTTSVTIIDLPSAPIAGSNSTLCAGTTLSLTASFTAGAVYNWAGPNSFTSTAQNPTIFPVSVAASGIYTVFAGLAGCTGPTVTIVVLVNPIPAAPTATNNSPICAFQTLSLGVNPGGAIYAWTGPNSFTSNIQFPTIVGATTLAAGIYSVTQTVLGCTSPEATTSVIVNNTPLAPIAANNSTICAGATLSLTANPGGGTFMWNGPNSFTSALQNPVIVGATTLATGMYSVTMTIGGCTSAEGTTSVTIVPPPSAPNASSNSTLCVGTTLSLTATFTPGAIYNWSGPNSFTSALQSPTIFPVTLAASGDYTVFVGLAGCSGPTITINVSVTPLPPAPIATSNSSLCEGQTLNLFANPGGALSYSWTGPNGFTSAVQNPTIGAITLLANGDYSVTQNLLGCDGPAGVVSVTVNPIPAAPSAANNSTICAGQTLSLTASPGGAFSYSWTGPNTFTSNLQNPTIVGASTLASGVYSVTQNLLGCESPAGTTTVTIADPPSGVIAASNSSLCAGQTLSLIATFTPGAVYNWVGPNSFTSNVQNPTISPVQVVASGDYTIFAGIPGCFGPTVTINVSITPIPAAPNAANNTTMCSGGTLSLTANPSGAFSYSWTGPNTFTSNLQNPVIANAGTIASGVYTVTQNVLGCESPEGTTTVTIIDLPSQVDATSNSSLCAGGTLSLSASFTTGTNYNWIGPDGFTSTAQNPTISPVSVAASGVYTVWAGLPGCTGPTVTINVTITPIPAAPTPSSNSSICSGRTLSLTVTPGGADSYFWSGPNGFTSTVQNPVIPNASSLIVGEYFVYQTVLGCESAASTTTVTLNPSPVGDFTNSSVCQGHETFFTDVSTIAGGSVTVWNWSFSNPTATSNIQNPSHTFVASGSYSVSFIVISDQGCSDTVVKTVNVSPGPKANFTMSPNPVPAEQNVAFVDLSTAPSSTITSWTWGFGNGQGSTSQNPNYAYPDKGIYTVTLTITDNSGCRDSITDKITVTLPPLLPTAFTPNGDGFNDILYVKGGPFKRISFRVYNNWGELIYVNDDQEKGWDGTYKGQPVPLGVYVWILDADLFDNTSVRKTGDVTVLK